jgi:dTDP-4-dehydrorhamnose reductase
MDAVSPILVAGCSGQLARCLVDVARAQSRSLVAVGRPQLDITKPADIARVVRDVRPSAIINAAAYTAVERAESEPTPALVLNRDAPAQLSRAAAAARIPFIHISTDYVFDGAKPAPYVETDATAPLNAYGRSKLAGEAAVREAHSDAVVVRTSWIYSPYGKNFVKTMLTLADGRDELAIVDDQHGSPTAAADLARALLAILETISDRANCGGIYHLAGTGYTTWRGFAAEIFAGWEMRGHRVPRVTPIATAARPSAVTRPLNSRFDCGKAERVFRLRLPPWRDSLMRCLDTLAADAEAA